MADTKYILRYLPVLYEELEEKVETKGLPKQSFSLDNYLLFKILPFYSDTNTETPILLRKLPADFRDNKWLIKYFLEVSTHYYAL